MTFAYYKAVSTLLVVARLRRHSMHHLLSMQRTRLFVLIPSFVPFCAMLLLCLWFTVCNFMQGLSAVCKTEVALPK